MISTDISLTLATGNGQVLIDPDGESAVGFDVAERQRAGFNYFGFKGFGTYTEDEVSTTLKQRDFKDATDFVVREI